MTIILNIYLFDTHAKNYWYWINAYESTKELDWWFLYDHKWLAENGILLNIRYLYRRGALLYTETNDDNEKSRNRARKDESSAQACPQSLLNHGIVGRAESSESNSRGARTAENLQLRSIVESDAKERERIFPSHREYRSLASREL